MQFVSLLFFVASFFFIVIGLFLCSYFYSLILLFGKLSSESLDHSATLEKSTKWNFWIYRVHAASLCVLRKVLVKILLKHSVVKTCIDWFNLVWQLSYSAVCFCDSNIEQLILFISLNCKCISCQMVNCSVLSISPSSQDILEWQWSMNTVKLFHEKLLFHKNILFRTKLPMNV